jgi:hypothetical protein
MKGVVIPHFPLIFPSPLPRPPLITHPYPMMLEFLQR